MRQRWLRLVFILSIVPLPAAAQEGARQVGASGLPLPRFASLASDEINLRTGPGTEYPIRWVYERESLPVLIVEEFDVWRRVRDPEGGEGWAHASLLTTRRTVMVRGGAPAPMHRSADDGSRVLLRAEPGVIGSLFTCTAEWCRVEIADTSGWVRQSALWGAAAAD